MPVPRHIIAIHLLGGFFYSFAAIPRCLPKLPLTLKATPNVKLLPISCQAEKQPERKDAHRKPLLKQLTGK
jgi:hypothetical protein